MRLQMVLLAGLVIGWSGGSLRPAQSGSLTFASQMDAAATPLTEAPRAVSAAPPAPVARPAAQHPAPAATARRTSTRSRIGVNARTLAQYRIWIRDARADHPYADSAARMYAVMMCESNGQANQIDASGPYLGLFQYDSATWKAAWNRYRDQDILDPKAQIFATALAWHKHMQRRWGCYGRIKTVLDAAKARG